MASIPFLNRARKIPRSKGEVAKDVGIKTGEKVVIGVVGIVPIAIVLAVVILLVVSVIGVLGHASEDSQFAQQTGLDSVFNNTPNQSSQVNPGGPPGTGGNPQVDCADPDSFFSQNQVTVNGVTSISKKQIICKALDVLFSYQEIDRYMTNKSLVINSASSSTCASRGSSWAGCTPRNPGNTIILNNFDSDNRSAGFWNNIITHEFFHSLDNLTDVKSGYVDPYPSDQANCYTKTNNGYYVISSYVGSVPNLADGLSYGGVRDESFAESGTLYVTGGKGTAGNLNSFQSSCPGNYNFWSQTIGQPSQSSGTGSTANMCTAGSTNDCGLQQYSSYMSKSPTHTNFGDPTCELAQNGTINRNLIQQEIMRQLQVYGKTVDYCRWTCIAQFEGGYNPNSFNQNTPRALGAWGMFQMLPWACFDTSKPYNYNRTGNVAWKDQIARALALEYKALEPNGIDWHYWSTYKWTCYKEPDWNPTKGCVTGGN